MAASFLLLLTSVGLFLSAQAQYCSRPVGEKNMGLKGDDILLQAFPNGIKVTFACDVGYVTAGGSASMTCTEGTWSPLGMTCKRKTCSALEEVPNGNVDYPEGNEFGDKLTVTCKPGYNMVGNAIILCGNEGWMSRPPVCEVLSCHPPMTPTIGSVYPDKDAYVYGEVIQFSCPKHFTLNGSKSLTCSETGFFRPAVPECVQVDCKEPVVEFGHWDSGSRSPYTYKATVTFKCNKGYRMTNDPTIICGINELWEPELPKCEAVPADTTTTKRPASTEKPTAVPADTTTTKRPASTEKPTAAPDPNGGKRLYTGLGVAFAVIALVAIAVGLWRCGFLKWPMKKTGSGSGRARTEEEVGLGKRDDDAAGPKLLGVESIS